MKTALNLLLLATILLPPAFIGGGCASTRPLAPDGVYQSDRILFTSEATTPPVFEAVNTFLAWERRNRAELWLVTPDIKHFADKLREEFPAQKTRADQLHDLYESTRSEVARAQLEDILRTLEGILVEITNYQVQAAAAGIAPPTTNPTVTP